MKSETPRNDALRKCAAANPSRLIEIMLTKHKQIERELNEAKVMLQICDVAIATGVWPQHDSPCHQKLREIYNRGRDA